MPEMRHGGAAFANFIFDLAKHIQRPEAAFGEPSTNQQICVSQGEDRDAELVNLIGLRERLGNEVITNVAMPSYSFYVEFPKYKKEAAAKYIQRWR